MVKSHETTIFPNINSDNVCSFMIPKWLPTLLKSLELNTGISVLTAFSWPPLTFTKSRSVGELNYSMPKTIVYLVYDMPITIVTIVFMGFINQQT